MDLMPKAQAFLEGAVNKIESSEHKWASDGLSILAEKANTDKWKILGLFTLIPVMLIVYLLGGGRLIVNLIGFLYPAIKSFKAIESQTSKDDVQWLTYWIIYGSFSISEHALSFIVNAIPHYWLIKIAFLMWCYLPKTQGATKVYDKLLKPYVVPAIVPQPAPVKKTE